MSAGENFFSADNLNSMFAESAAKKMFGISFGDKTPVKITSDGKIEVTGESDEFIADLSQTMLRNIGERTDYKWMCFSFSPGKHYTCLENSPTYIKYVVDWTDEKNKKTKHCIVSAEIENKQELSRICRDELKKSKNKDISTIPCEMKIANSGVRNGEPVISNDTEMPFTQTIKLSVTPIGENDLYFFDKHFSNGCFGARVKVDGNEINRFVAAANGCEAVEKERPKAYRCAQTIPYYNKSKENEKADLKAQKLFGAETLKGIYNEDVVEITKDSKVRVKNNGSEFIGRIGRHFLNNAGKEKSECNFEVKTGWFDCVNFSCLKNSSSEGYYRATWRNASDDRRKVCYIRTEYGDKKALEESCRNAPADLGSVTEISYRIKMYASKVVPERIDQMRDKNLETELPFENDINLTVVPQTGEKTTKSDDFFSVNVKLDGAEAGRIIADAENLEQYTMPKDYVSTKFIAISSCSSDEKQARERRQKREQRREQRREQESATVKEPVAVGKLAESPNKKNDEKPKKTPVTKPSKGKKAKNEIEQPLLSD